MPKRLPSYLEEFTLRFNRLNSRSRVPVFRRLLEQAMVTGAATDAHLAHGYQWELHNR